MRRHDRTIELLESRRLLSIVPIGPEYQVNSFTTDRQRFQAIAMDAAGDLVVAWQSLFQDGSSYGIYAQRYSAGGVPQGGEFRVNTYTTDSQTNPAVAMDAQGDFVIAWNRSDQAGQTTGIYAQRYDGAGVPQGVEFRVNSTTTLNRQSPCVAMDPAGDFVIGWQGGITAGSFQTQSIFAQRYNSAGAAQGGEFRVNTITTANQVDPQVAMDAAGDFVVAWSRFINVGGHYQSYARRYNSAGVATGPDFLVNTYTGTYQWLPSVAMDAAGDFVIAWESSYQDGSSYGVYAQRYSPSAVPQGDEFLVNNYTTNTQRVPAVAMDAAGDFVVSWASYAQDGSNFGIYARRYIAAGAAQGAEFQVNTYTTGAQDWPAIAGDANGDFVVTWTSDGQDGSSYGIYAQRYDVVPDVTASSFVFDTAPQKLNFTFNHDVSGSLSSDDLLVQNLTTGQTIASGDVSLSYNISTNLASFTDTAGVLPDGNYRAKLLSAGITTPQGASMATDYSFDFFVLAGDANHDQRVDVTDLGILATNWQGTGKTFSQADFNYDGKVDVSDLGILATNWQKTLAASASPALSAAAPPRSHGHGQRISPDVLT
jgi:hypothetical protein